MANRYKNQGKKDVYEEVDLVDELSPKFKHRRLQDAYSWDHQYDEEYEEEEV